MSLTKVVILETVTVAFLMTAFLFIPQKETKTLCFSQECFRVEVARTSREQKKGLMFRRLLDEDKGMLFVFSHPDTYAIWMKNTLIPLDIIWFDQDLKIVYTQENAQPCSETCPSIQSTQSAQYILEINGGMIAALGLKTGDIAVVK